MEQNKHQNNNNDNNNNDNNNNKRASVILSLNYLKYFISIDVAW